MAIEWSSLAGGLIGGGVGGTVLSALFAARQENSVWAREQQHRSLQQLMAAFDASLAAVADPVGDAMQRHDFVGLDEAVAAAHAATAGVEKALVTEFTLWNSRQTILQVSELVAVWGDLVDRACPLSGCTHPAAGQQRGACVAMLFEVRLVLGLLLRSELGRRWRRLPTRRTPKLAVEGITRRSADLDFLAREVPRETLVAWRVRAWTTQGFFEPDVGVGYVTHTYPWAALPPTHAVLMQEMAAMLIRVPNEPWKLAISSDVPAESLLDLERSLALYVTTHGSGASGVPFPSDGWVEGSRAGERLHLWTLDRIQQRASDTPHATSDVRGRWAARLPWGQAPHPPDNIGSST